MSAPDSELTRIRRLLAAGEARRALAASSQLVAANPADPEALRLHATCLGASGAWERAVLAYRNLALQRPHDPSVGLALAGAQIATGDAGAALVTLDHAGRTGASSTALGLRARALTLAGDADAAAAVRRDLAVSHPEDPEIRAELARALARIGAFAEADRVLDRSGAEIATPGLAAAAAEVAARRHGPAATAAWWAAAAAAGTLPLEVVVPTLRTLSEAGRHRDLLEWFGRLDAPPAAGALVPIVAAAISTLGGGSTEPGVLRESLARAGLTPAAFWSRVVHHLIQQSAFDAARALLAALPDRPDVDRLRARLAKILAALPADGDLPDELRLDDARRPSVLVYRSPGARGTAIVLGARASRMLHTVLVGRGLDLIHLEDYRDLNFLGGIPELGGDWASTVGALGELARDPGPRGLFVAGMSGGAYAAVRLGVDLDAKAVLSLAPPTDLHQDTITADAWGLSKLARIQQNAPELVGDLRAVLLAIDVPPRVHLWHGADHVRDSRHAERLTGLPGVTMHSVAGAARHNVLLDMIDRGLLDAAVDEWLTG